MSRKKDKLSGLPIVSGRHNMTCSQLCDCDDWATTVTVDAVFGFTTHKMDKNYNSSFFNNKLCKKWKYIMQEFIKDLNYENTFSKLISFEEIKFNLKNDERFKHHVFRFLYLFDKRSGIEIIPCHRYENEGKMGAGIFATKEWKQGSQISTLFGCIAEMNEEEEKIFNEFSVMYSTRKNCSQLWLGPAAYVNHDCKPNCKFTEGNDDSKMTLETLRDIHPGDELLIYYGKNFFGVDNVECECFTCELCDKGLFNRIIHNKRSSNSPPLNLDNNSTRRHIITRSTKVTVTDQRSHTYTTPLSHNLPANLDKLSKSSDSYPLRITYSRIDRAKKRILAQNLNTSVTKSFKSNNISLKPKLFLSTIQRLKTIKSKRKQSKPPLRDNQREKMAIETPNQYESLSFNKPLLKPSDTNIFTRLSQLIQISKSTSPYSDIGLLDSNYSTSSISVIEIDSDSESELSPLNTSTRASFSNKILNSECLSSSISVIEIGSDSESELNPPQPISELIEPHINKGISSNNFKSSNGSSSLISVIEVGSESESELDSPKTIKCDFSKGLQSSSCSTSSISVIEIGSESEPEPELLEHPRLRSYQIRYKKN